MTVLLIIASALAGMMVFLGVIGLVGYIADDEPGKFIGGLLTVTIYIFFLVMFILAAINV